MGRKRGAHRNVRTGRARSRQDSAPAARRFRDRILLFSVLGVLLLLAVFADDRHIGLVADGRQMIRTAVAIAHTGEIGQARGRDFTFERPQGDGVSRFGLATSLLQVPAALVAPPVEATLGPGSSQALFLILPWLAVGAAAAAAGAITRSLGGGDLQVVSAVLLASIASPLGSYAAMEFSEPVQAAALTVALAAALAAAQSSTRRRLLEFAAGFAAATAVLAKSSLILAAPAALLPLVDLRALDRTRRAVLAAGAGAAGPLLVWAAFEFVRFGRLFGGYPDDRFTHPWFEGFWRLLIGPNRGLFLFWPALLLFIWFGVRRMRDPLGRAADRAWIGAAWVLLAQLAIAAGYWGWHGMEGWGPRLILSAIPLLAAFAAAAPVPRAVLAGGVAVCVVVNAPPLVQHPTPVATYVMNVPWPEVPEADRWRYPFYATARNAEGRLTVVPFEVLEKEPSANPWVVYHWLWHLSPRTGDALMTGVRNPPWKAARPNLVPPATWSADVARQIVPPRRIGFLGRSLTGTGGPYATVYLDALLDQVVRATQQGRIERALQLSEQRLRLSADGEAAAWRLEALRRAGQGEEAERLLRSLHEGARRHPLVNVVLALFDRDFGEERRARALLGSVAASFPDSPVQKALNAPLAEWPSTLDALTSTRRRDAAVTEPQ